MNRSIGRLAGIVSVFSRGFRSTASVTMPMKVRFSGFFHLWRETHSCVPFFAALVTCTREESQRILSPSLKNFPPDQSFF